VVLGPELRLLPCFWSYIFMSHGMAIGELIDCLRPNLSVDGSAADVDPYDPEWANL
jgi:hypothetical protein